MSIMTLRMPAQLDKQLAKLSKRRNLSKSDIAREAIERYVRAQIFEDSRTVTVPLAQAQGVFSDEDVFRKLGLDAES